VALRFIELCDGYGGHFVVKGKDVGSHARSYLSGLVGTQRRKNIERIGEAVEASLKIVEARSHFPRRASMLPSSKRKIRSRFHQAEEDENCPR
jgi:hypothetical protein